MDKTISSSSFDVIVIRQPNRSYKSTPFQVAFSSNLLKNITKKNQVQLYVNDEKIDIPLRLDIQNGRIAFIKKYQKRNILSDSSDFSDDQISQRSQSRDKIISKNISNQKQKKTDDFKNQKLPKPFWQFAWLFNSKNQLGQNKPQQKELFKQINQSAITTDQSQPSTLQKIDEQLYQGEQSSKQPMFHISLCKSALKKKQKRQDILTQFYKRRIPYQQFIKDPPKYLTDSQLIVKIDDSLYTWQLGIAILTCRLAYGKQLSPQLIDDMIRNKFTKSKFITYFTGQNLTKIDISTTTSKKQFTVLNSSTNNFPTKLVTRYRKSPDTETIQKMKLKQGMNKAKFILNTGATKQQINMKIFLWDYREKLIVSDIDGTITKSDIAGQLLTNYIHVGVTKLFAEAYKRGYKIVYLTARAIGQYNQTTKFLESAEENGIKLPEGPLLMSPDGFLKSFTREVIDKTPDYLKTKILATLNEIFPHRRRPLYCGFGNRETDSVAYLRTNMDPERIFFITPKSIISKQSKADFNTTYVEMLQKIQEYFPLFTKQQQQAISAAEDNLRQSKLSMDLQEQQQPAKNDAQNSLSQSSQQSSHLTKQNNLQLSQRINRSNLGQVEEMQLKPPTQKHLRSKSVQHTTQLQNQQGHHESLFKELIKNINPFNTREPMEPISPKMTPKQIQQKVQEINQPLPVEDQYQAPKENKVLKTSGDGKEENELRQEKQEKEQKEQKQKQKQVNVSQCSSKSKSSEKIKIE